MYHVSSKNKYLWVLLDILAIIASYYSLFLIFDNKLLCYKDILFLLEIIVFTMIANTFTETYRYIEIRGFLREFTYAIVYAVQIAIVFCFVLFINKDNYIDALSEINWLFIITLFLVSLAFVYVFRLLGKLVGNSFGSIKKKVIVVTNLDHIDSLEKTLGTRHDIVAYIHSDPTKQSYHEKPILHNKEEIRFYMATNTVDEIFVESRTYDQFSKVLEYVKLLGVPTSIDVSEFSNQFVGESAIKQVEDRIFITSAISIVTVRQMLIKRIIDIIGSIVGLIITVIVGILIAPIIYIQSPGPLIFKQKRVGKNGQIFELYKFRSMYLDAEERKAELLEKNEMSSDLMFKMKNDPRIFPFGNILRNWSIDELPQFWNVLKGDMSLVGTRPPTLQEYQKYELHHFKRLFIKPGMTGLWQISGRSDITNFEDVVALDYKYIQGSSIYQDIKILFKTILVVLTRKGSR